MCIRQSWLEMSDWLSGMDIWFLWTGGFLVRRRGWRRRRGELGVVDGDVLLHLVDLNGEAVPGAREGPTVWDFYAVGVAVIGVVDLGWVAAESGFRVADEAKQ
jgi:hypothetical protein